jgi:cysteine-rich repeat protein
VKTFSAACALYVGVLVATAPSCSDDSGDGNDGGTGGTEPGTGGKGGTSGAGGGVGAPLEECPGLPKKVGADAVVIESTLEGRTDDVRPFCVSEDAQGPDVVYRFEVTQSGTLTLELAGPSPSPTLFLTAGECDDLSRTLWCETARTLVVANTPRLDGGARFDSGTSIDAASPPPDASVIPPDASAVIPRADASVVTPDASAPGAGGVANVPPAAPLDAGSSLSTTANVAVEIGDVLYAVVDGQSGAKAFSLRATVHEARCGDRAVNPGEDCDYGDTRDGDGCSALCIFEPAGPDDVCGADVRALLPSTPVTIEGYTIGYGDNHTPLGRPCENVQAGGRDRVYGFFSASAGVLEVTAEADFDIVLYAMAACTDGELSGLLACADSDRRTSAETISLPIPPNTTYHVVVDGHHATAYGTFRLRVTFK